MKKKNGNLDGNEEKMSPGKNVERIANDAGSFFSFQECLGNDDLL